MIPGTYLNEKEKIEKEIEKLKEVARTLQEQHRGPALESIIKAMLEYDISADDIAVAYRSATRTSRQTGAKKTVPPKYRDPSSGQTWSGRGRTPRWLTAAEARGQHRDTFLIK